MDPPEGSRKKIQTLVLKKTHDYNYIVEIQKVGGLYLYGISEKGVFFFDYIFRIDCIGVNP